jgi:zinc transporter ZupT
MSIWEYILLFSSVLIGGAAIYVFQMRSGKQLKLVLSFSGAYILGITVLHLMPGVFSSDFHHLEYFVLLGFVIQLMVDQLSQGVEHGHIHAHQGSKWALGIQVMLGLCLHAFLEGLPLAEYESFHASHHADEHNHNHLFWGIIIHKVPAAFALGLLLREAGFEMKKVFGFLIIFAAMSPLGAFTTTLLGQNLELLSQMVAIVVGSFLHIATTIIFEADENKQHRISWPKIGAIAIGLGISMLTTH